MRKLDPVLLLTIADIFTDLSAGWFGAVLILPIFTRIDSPPNILLLSGDFGAGIISLLTAYKLRKMQKRRRK